MSKYIVSVYNEISGYLHSSYAVEASTADDAKQVGQEVFKEENPTDFSPYRYAVQEEISPVVHRAPVDGSGE